MDRVPTGELLIVSVWLSRENDALARAELSAATERLGGRITVSREGVENGRASVELPDRRAAVDLAGRLGLAHRCAELWSVKDLPSLEKKLGEAGAAGAAASIRWVSGGLDPRRLELLRRLGRVYAATGGRIDLRNPTRRFWLEATAGGETRFFEELGPGSHSAFAARRTPKLPFQRPVTLAPTLARALVNLAHVGPGDRVIDPFVGTGSLLLEAALLGARTVGVDASATMIRGALQNFAHFGLAPDDLRQSDSAEAAEEFPAAAFDALVTDPPYGRASGTRGEPPDQLWRRTLAAWTARVRPGGRLGIVVPQGAPLPELDARLVVSIPQRVHGSLTREFRVYLRPEPGPGPQ